MRTLQRDLLIPPNNLKRIFNLLLGLGPMFNKLGMSFVVKVTVHLRPLGNDGSEIKHDALLKNGAVHHNTSRKFVSSYNKIVI